MWEAQQWEVSLQTGGHEWGHHMPGLSLWLSREVLVLIASSASGSLIRRCQHPARAAVGETGKSAKWLPAVPSVRGHTWFSRDLLVDWRSSKEVLCTLSLSAPFYSLCLCSKEMKLSHFGIVSIQYNSTLSHFGSHCWVYKNVVTFYRVVYSFPTFWWRVPWNKMWEYSGTLCSWCMKLGEE